MYTLEEVREKVDKHNAFIDHFIMVDLADRLGAVDGKINIEQWFKGQQIIKEAGLYDKAVDLLYELRADGWIVLIDMQSNKLIFRGFRLN